MQLTVLGKSPSYQDAGGACSGYLIEDGTTSLLLDCGSGVFGKLRAYREYSSVDAVVVSHLHADHFLDLFPFAFALLYSPRRAAALHGSHGSSNSRPALFGPPGAREAFRQISGAWQMETLLEDAFELSEYEPDRELRVGTFTLRFELMPHYIPSYAIEVTSTETNKRLTVSGDLAPCEKLSVFALDTDLLLLEATLQEPEMAAIRGHLTAVQAGEHAQRANARRLVLTHISDELDQERSLKDAQRAYDGTVELAREGSVFEV